MPETRTYQVYEFSELSEQAQEKALERIAQMNHEYYDPDQLTEQFAEKLQEWGFPTNNIEWSLSYSQGDGVAFYGNVDVEQYLRKSKQRSKYHRMLTRSDGVGVQIIRNSFGHHYSHYNTMEVECEIYANTLKQEELREPLRESIENHVREVSRELEKLGYVELERVSSREYIVEQIEINEWVFTESGVID